MSTQTVAYQIISYITQPIQSLASQIWNIMVTAPVSLAIVFFRYLSLTGAFLSLVCWVLVSLSMKFMTIVLRNKMVWIIISSVLYFIYNADPNNKNHGKFTGIIEATLEHQNGWSSTLYYISMCYLALQFCDTIRSMVPKNTHRNRRNQSIQLALLLIFALVIVCYAAIYYFDRIENVQKIEGNNSQHQKLIIKSSNYSTYLIIQLGALIFMAIFTSTNFFFPLLTTLFSYLIILVRLSYEKYAILPIIDSQIGYTDGTKELLVLSGRMIEVFSFLIFCINAKQTRNSKQKDENRRLKWTFMFDSAISYYLFMILSGKPYLIEHIIAFTAFLYMIINSI